MKYIKYNIVNYYMYLFLTLFISFSIKLAAFFLERKFDLLSQCVDSHLGFFYIIFDFAFWVFFLHNLRKMLSRDRAMFDFIESSLIVFTVLTNFYVSIINASLYFGVFDKETSTENIVLTMITFANGNATYTNIFDKNEIFFSIISMCSYLMLVLIISILVSALSAKNENSGIQEE